MSLQDVESDLAHMKERHEALAATCMSTSQTVARMDRELFGNGQPGLVVQVAQLQQSVKLLMKVAGVVGTGIILGLVGIFLKMASVSGVALPH